MNNDSRIFLKTAKASKEQTFKERYLNITFVVPLLLVATVIIAILISMGEAPRPTPTYLQYSTVAGYFLQDDAETDWRSFDYTKNFGLKSKDWQTFSEEVDKLNKDATSNTKYKVLFLGRHGEGYHNVAEAYYGTKAWDCYYSMLEGNSTTSWADAELTPKGVAQAELASRTWVQALNAGLPPPQLYYSSPLTRCLQTAYHTFSTIAESLDSRYPFRPKVKELLRETIGVHTCDRRSRKTAIEDFWRSYDKEVKMPFTFDSDFAENDELWDKEMRELPAGEDRRSQQAMDAIFEQDEAVYIAISGHSGIIASLLRVLGHRDFGLTTGAVIPVLVRCDIMEGVRKPIEGEGYEKIVGCREPPGKGAEGAVGEPAPHAAVES